DQGINGPLALVVLTSGGAITGGNGPATNVTANGLTATSASGIDLDTRVGALLINGNGPITLTEALNTRITSIRVGTGTVTLDGGTFIPVGDDIITAGTLNVAGATVDFHGTVQLPNKLQLTDGTIQNSVSGGGPSCTNDYDVRNGTISATLSGNVGLVKST